MPEETKNRETKKGKVEVSSSKEGKLTIKPSELFALESVQKIIEKAARSQALSDARKVSLEGGG